MAFVQAPLHPVNCEPRGGGRGEADRGAVGVRARACAGAVDRRRRSARHGAGSRAGESDGERPDRRGRVVGDRGLDRYDLSVIVGRPGRERGGRPVGERRREVPHAVLALNPRLNRIIAVGTHRLQCDPVAGRDRHADREWAIDRIDPLAGVHGCRRAGRDRSPVLTAGTEDPQLILLAGGSTAAEKAPRGQRPGLGRGQNVVAAGVPLEHRHVLTEVVKVGVVRRQRRLAHGRRIRARNGRTAQRNHGRHHHGDPACHPHVRSLAIPVAPMTTTRAAGYRPGRRNGNGRMASRPLPVGEPETGARYSVALNSQIAIESITRPSRTMTPASSSVGTCQPHQVTPGSRAWRAADEMCRWLKTILRIGSTA